MRGRPAIPRLVALLLLAVALLGLGGPAQARDAGLLVAPSASGPYADQLPAPLFEGLGEVVPLDRARRTFHVKNASPQAARTTVAVVNRGEANALTGALTVTVDVAGTASTGSLAPEGERCDLTVTGPRLGPGEVQPVEVSLAVGDLPGQQGMRQQFALDLDVVLTEDTGADPFVACGEEAAGPAPDADCERTAVVTVAGAPSCVPTAVDAGGHSGWWVPREPGTVPLTGLTIVVLGALVLLAVRRRRERDVSTAAGAGATLAPRG